MCDFPVNIKNPDWGKMDSDPESTYFIQVPCGKCPPCYLARQKQWFVRLHNELKISETANFVTLTFDVPQRTKNGLLTAEKLPLQNFLKRLRKREIGNNSIKYYACSEYGEKSHRPHYHLIIFNVKSELNIARAWTLYDDEKNNYKSGLYHIGKVEEASINYVTGYIGKRIGIPFTDDDDRTPEFSLMSKNLGMYYVDKAKNFHNVTEQSYTVINGIKYTLPRYYKNLIFPDYKLRKIGKKNYENYLKNQARDAKNFPSYFDFEKNQWDARNIRNSNKPDNFKSSI